MENRYKAKKVEFGIKVKKRKKCLLCEVDDIEKSLSIPTSLKLHKLVGSNISDDVVRIDFYFLLNGKEIRSP